ncbi:MAG: hypothetical protein IJQ50_06350 [Clostridia bacterium]|nr:hypothetical protein [Clostridia bacterium]
MSYYKELKTVGGKEIDEKYALGYAIEQVLNNPKETSEFIEWFFSGNWVKIEKGDEKYEN